MTIPNPIISIERGNFSPCNYLPDTHYQVSDMKYISDVIDDDWLYAWTPKVPVFISAQTGSGKNHFIRNTLIPGFFKEKPVNHSGKILMLSNRTALNRQTKLLIAETIDNFSGRYDKQQVNKINDVSDTGLDKLEDFGDVFICSYQRLLGNDLLKNTYDFVVIDECHFFTSDAVFNQNTEDILNVIINQFKNAVRIYMSATPDVILTKIIEKETKNTRVSDVSIKTDYYTDNLKIQINPDVLPFFIKTHNKDEYNQFFPLHTFLNKIYLDGFELPFSQDANEQLNLFTSYSYGENTYHLNNDKAAWVYDTIRDYSYLNIKYFRTNTSVISTIVDIITESQKLQSKDKWIIFVSTKEQGIDLETQLNTTPFNKQPFCSTNFATFISAKSKTDSNTYNKIINKECFDEQILISTSVLDNGINIADPSVKNIIILTFDRTQFIQMLGRIRTQQETSINLYLTIPPISEITNLLKTYQRTLIDYLDFECSSDSDKQQFHRRLFSSSYSSNSNWDINEDQDLIFNALAKTSLLDKITALKNLLRKTLFEKSILNLTENDYRKIKSIASVVLLSKHKDFLFDFYSKLPHGITSPILEKLLYLQEESGEYIAAFLDTIPDFPKDHFIPDSWDSLSNKDLQAKIDNLLSTRYYSQPRKDISSLDYSYLKKYEFFSHKINSIRYAPNESNINNEKLSILINEQKKYRILFNYKLPKNYDSSYETLSNDDIYNLNIIKEQLSWLERLDDFNEKNFHLTASQENNIIKEEKNHQFLLQLMTEYAIPSDQYIEAKNIPSTENLPASFLTKEIQETFRSKFTAIYQQTFGKRPKDKPNTTSYGLNIINECLKENQLPYTIKSDSTDKKTTYWIIIKNK